MSSGAEFCELRPCKICQKSFQCQDSLFYFAIAADSCFEFQSCLYDAKYTWWCTFWQNTLSGEGGGQIAYFLTVETVANPVEGRYTST